MVAQQEQPKQQKSQPEIKICTDKNLSYDPATQLKAYKIAKSKNMRNIPEANIIDTVHLALVRTKFHQVGGTLRIKFLNGTDAQKTKVKEMALDWLNYANVKFEWV